MAFNSGILKEFEARLAAAGNGNPKRAVEELAAHVLGCKPLEIYFRDIRTEQLVELEQLIARAELDEPIQYIIGHVDFRGLEILCDRRALIPRPETELLVEAVLKSEIRNRRPLRMADVGTGTGCIALALLSELPDAEVIALDISSDALMLARANAERLGLSGRFQAIENNLLEGFEAASLDLVVSNPPYILTGVCAQLEPCVRCFEPMSALDGGGDGLDLIRPLATQASQVLKPDGCLFLEIGYDQGAAASGCLKKAGFRDVGIRKDFAGHDRIVYGRI